MIHMAYVKEKAETFYNKKCWYKASRIEVDVGTTCTGKIWIMYAIIIEWWLINKHLVKKVITKNG